MLDKVVGVLMLLVALEIVLVGVRWAGEMWNGMRNPERDREGRELLEELKERNKRERGI